MHLIQICKTACILIEITLRQLVCTKGIEPIFVTVMNKCMQAGVHKLL